MATANRHIVERPAAHNTRLRLFGNRRTAIKAASLLFLLRSRSSAYMAVSLILTDFCSAYCTFHQSLPGFPRIRYPGKFICCPKTTIKQITSMIPETMPPIMRLGVLPNLNSRVCSPAGTSTPIKP